MAKEYLGTPISLRKFENAIIVEYGDKFNSRKPVKALESNMVYACYNKVKEILKIDVQTEYMPCFGCNDKKVFEGGISDDVFDAFSNGFFSLMDEKVEKMLELIFEVMDTPLEKYLTYANSDSFDVLKYFMDFEEIPSVDDFYKVKRNNEYCGIKMEYFYNIKRDACYRLFDYTGAELKKDSNRKNKFVVKFNGMTDKRFKTYDEAFDYLSERVNFVKTE